MALKRSLAWMALAQGGSFVLQFAGSVVLARLLTVHDMGVYAVAAAAAGVLYVVQALGLQSLIVREEDLTNSIRATAFTVNALMSIGLACAIYGLSFLGNSMLGDAGIRKVLTVLSISPLFGIFDFLPSATLEREGRFKVIAIIGIISGIVYASVQIILAIRGFSYMSLAYASLLSSAVGTAGFNIIARKHVSFRVGLASWRRVASFGGQMLAINGIHAVASRFSDIALGRIRGLSALGLFNRASNLNNLLWNNIHLVIGRVVLVDYAEMNRQGISLRSRYIRTVEILTALLWPAFAGFALLSGPFVLAVYGVKWLPATHPFALLAIASMINVAITMSWELFAATGQLGAQTRIEFLRAPASLLLFVGGCMISLNAAAAARILDAVFCFFVYRPHVSRMTQTSFADFIPVYIKSLGLTALAICPATLLMTAFAFSPLVPLALVLLSIIIGLALWVGGIFMFHHPFAEEISGTLGRFGGRLSGRWS